MKRFAGLLSVIFLLAACHRPAIETRHGTSLPSELVTIDTLMQTRPDSALSLLLDTPMDDPYYQLLLSEAFYKNDSTQLNRLELQAAMAYFDSVDYPFLSARCHYINGVGYYEMDSVVPACREYLRALDIMEEHFEEKDLVGDKAKFMALTYTHLTNLFSDQYLNEQVIYFGKQSLSFYYMYDAETWHVAWILDVIGANYEMLGVLDSAAVYYNKALQVLSDTVNLTYRGLVVHKAFLEYEISKEPQLPLRLLHQQLIQSESVKEYLSRCLTIGEIYYRELQFDSAYLYLGEVFRYSESINSKKQAAEWLAEVCKSNGESTEPYAAFLVPFANQEENKSEIKSQLTELYSEHIQKMRECVRQREQKYYKKWMIGTVVSLMVLLLVTFTIIHKNRKRRHKSQIRALGGRLRESNEALCTEKKEKARLLQQLNMQQNQKTWSGLDDFTNEPICQEILGLFQDVYIKRDSKSDDYPQLWLNENQLSQLTVAVERHFYGFSEMLSKQYPRINPNEIYQCILSLLNLDGVKIAALLHCDYSTISKRSVKLKKAFGTDKSLQVYFRELVLK